MYNANESTANALPAFITKLWALVEDPQYRDLICWDESGYSFHVYNQSRFAKEILPQYFKHANIASFIRQLNMYGFRKVVSLDQGALNVGKDDLEFTHQYFLRGREDLLESIKRKSPTLKMLDQSYVKSSAKVTNINNENINQVLTDVCTMKETQQSITSLLSTLLRENAALWREVALLRQKHIKQQQVVDKLIKFLMSLVGKHGIKRKLPLMLGASAETAAAVEDEREEDMKKLKLQLLADNDDALFNDTTEKTMYQVHSPDSVQQGESLGDDSGNQATIHDVSDRHGQAILLEDLTNARGVLGTILEPNKTHPEEQMWNSNPPYFVQLIDSPSPSTVPFLPATTNSAQGMPTTVATNILNFQPVNQPRTSINPSAIPSPFSKRLAVPVQPIRSTVRPLVQSGQKPVPVASFDLPTSVLLLNQGPSPQQSRSSPMGQAMVAKTIAPTQNATRTVPVAYTSSQGLVPNRVPVLRSVSPARTVSVAVPVSAIPSTVAALVTSIANWITTPAAATVATGTLPVATDILPVAVSPALTLERGDMEEKLDSIDDNLQNLYDLLSTSNYNFNTGFLHGLFTPDIPLPENSSSSPLQYFNALNHVGATTSSSNVPLTSSASLMTSPVGAEQRNLNESGTGTIVGSELIQYNPAEYLTTIDLDDLIGPAGEIDGKLGSAPVSSAQQIPVSKPNSDSSVDESFLLNKLDCDNLLGDDLD